VRSNRKKMNPDRPRDAVLYREKLLSLRGDSHIPYCHQRESSTGWLLYDVEMEQWFVGFRCPDHGHGGAWRPEWQPLIDEVIEAETKEGKEG
jgi:hypothetical protein